MRRVVETVRQRYIPTGITDPSAPLSTDVSEPPISIRIAAPFLLLGTLLFAPGAAAWEPWTLDDKVLPEPLSLGVQHRTRYEFLDEQFRAGQPGDTDGILLRTLVHGRIKLFEGIHVGAELQDSRAERNGDTLLNNSMVNSVELLRAYLEFERGDFLGGSLFGQLGRITLDVGSRRFVARNRFRNTINSFAGVDISWKGSGGSELRGFYTLPVRRLPTQRDRLEDNEIRDDDQGFNLQFFGISAGSDLPVMGRGELFVFGLHEQDRPGMRTRRRKLFTPGLRLFRPHEIGRLDYELESALQFGESRASTTGKRLDHFAHFHHAEVGYSFGTRWSPRLALQYDFASGDDDPADGDNNRFDTLFGARRFDFGPTGIYGPFARANLNTPGVRLQLRPAKTVTSFVAFRGFWLADKRDSWTTAGVRDAAGDSGRFVGSQVELRVRWKLLPGNVMLEAGFAHLFAGKFIDNAPNSNDQGDSNYVYTQAVIGF